MTTELQRAMARYEEARGRYQKAVLASLDGASNGEAIRQAIHEFKAASAELRRVAPRRIAAMRAAEQVQAPRRVPQHRVQEKPRFTPLNFVWRLIRAS